MTDDQPSVPAALRTRLAADIAAGKTVSLSPTELADPELRAQLPALLDQLTGHGPAPAGVRVPGFTLLTEIGHGGMSTVYLARQDALHRHVALKVAPKWLAGDKRMQQRLLQEARAMARVSHPNVVAIHDILEVDDTVAISMDWIDGLSLTEVLRVLGTNARDDDLDRVREALGNPDPTSFPANITTWFVMVVRDIARAVHHVHEAGLLHLDIKPSNVLVRRDGTPLLADFGVVREIDLASTHTHSFAGTPIYAAPEQLQRQDRAFGAHTDVYGLGMTLYELLTRTQPLRGLDLTRVLQNVLSGRIAPIATRVPIAPDLATIVHKAIAPERDHRYADAAQLADDLTAFLEHRPVSARPLTRMQHVRRWARLEPWKALFAAVLLVTVPCLLGLGAYVWWQAPKIEQVQRAQLLQEASARKNAAYLAWFGGNVAEGEPTRLLHEAMELDPGATSLACLLAMSHEEGSDRTTELLDAHRELAAAHRGLQVFERKVRERRAFFVADEVRDLRHSGDVVDKYVLALDRVFRAEDRGHEAAYAEASVAVEEATTMAAADPLLLGLHLWTTSRAGAHERAAALARATRARWSHDPAALAWIYFAADLEDNDASAVALADLQELHPNHALVVELVASDRYRRKEYATCIEQIQSAAKRNCSSEALTALELMARARIGDTDAARRALRDLPKNARNAKREMFLQRLIDPAAADALRERLLTAPACSAQVLSFLVDDAAEHEHRQHVDVAWARFHELHPDRRAMHLKRLAQLYRRRDMQGCAEVLAEITLPHRARDPGNWRIVVTALATARSWRELERHARDWLATARLEDQREASAYVATALARTGRPAEAAMHFGAACSFRNETAAWFGHALIEDAWLRVAPKMPPELRDPVLARERLAALDAFLKQAGKFPAGSWLLLVRAEVDFANGDVARAREVLANARKRPHAERHAPEDLAELLDDAEQRYGR